MTLDTFRASHAVFPREAYEFGVGSVIGVGRKLLAICGRAVAMMVPSKFSMKNAPAMRVVT